MGGAGWGGARRRLSEPAGGESAHTTAPTTAPTPLLPTPLPSAQCPADLFCPVPHLLALANVLRVVHHVGAEDGLDHLQSRQRAAREQSESRQRAVRAPSASRQRAVREPSESRQRAVRGGWALITSLRSS
jgi:hypothetical protein